MSQLRPAVVPGSQESNIKPIRIQVVPDSAQVIIGKEKRSFTFDHVFLPESSQEHVYETAVATLITQFIQGFNATIFA